MSRNQKDLIYRQEAIWAMKRLHSEDVEDYFVEPECFDEFRAVAALEKLPSVQTDVTSLIEKIRACINSGNRGTSDYFIVDKIEEILNEYENVN